MKKSYFVFEVLSLILITLLVAFKSLQSAVIGKIIPADGADAVLAIAKNDTLQISKRSIITNGRFAMDVKPGIYKLIIDAHDPFQDVTLDNIEVKPGITRDLGEIRIH
jgi:hypothetical protein